LPIVELIFRKQNPLFFSIEKVFASLLDSLQKEVSIQARYVPFYSSSLTDLARNMIFAGKGKADIFHITGDVHYVALALPAKRTILTIHDAVFIRESKGLKRLFFKWIFLKLPVKKCRIVTTISEKSKNEIVRFTGCDPKKVVVIPNPVDKHIYFQEKEFNIVDPVLLFIGSTPNKNLDRIIEAVAGISCALEIVGRIPEEHLSLLKKHHIRFRQFINLSEEDMAGRYAACDIIIFPSLYEGFGLPILEGQKAGRAVLTSNISPMKEVAGAGACLVDPFDPDSIRTGIKKIIGDNGYRSDIIKKGFENVYQYDNQQIADQYLKLYARIMNP
jgi:glycosyltransferase involved in cell wall biosynthesis